MDLEDQNRHLVITNTDLRGVLRTLKHKLVVARRTNRIDTGDLLFQINEALKTDKDEGASE